MGIQEGKNHLYAYASSNPTTFIDPIGLAVYTGLVNLKGGGMIGGASVMYGLVKTKCEGGRYQEGFLVAGFVGANVGLPIGSTVYTITQEDHLAGRGDLNSMNGLAAITSLSAACGPGIYAYDLTLGNTRSVSRMFGSVMIGPELGLDLDAIAIGGYSHVFGAKEKCCQ